MISHFLRRPRLTHLTTMKQLSNKPKLLLLSIPLLSLLSSCEGYLENELQSDTSVEYLYETPEGLESAVVGLYALNRSIYENGANEWMTSLIMQLRSDLVLPRTGAGSLIGTYGWGEEVEDFGTSNRLRTLWTHHYRIVDRANTIIQAAETMDELEEAQQRQLLAEARCFRTHSYFSLYRMFNNIYLTTEPTTPDNAFERPNQASSEADIFALINGDLDFAIANLAETTPQFGRLTQAVARHIRA